MKAIKRMLLLGTLLPVSLCAQVQFLIKGKVGQLNAPAKVFLQYFDATAWIEDSAQLTNGAFEIKGAVDFPRVAYLRLRRNGGPMYQVGIVDESKAIYLENGTVTITGDSLPNAVVKGGIVNKEFIAYQQLLQPVQEKRYRFSMEYNRLSGEQRKSDSIKALLKKNALQFQLDEKAVNAAFIKKYPGSPVALNLLKYNYGKYPPVEEVASLYNMLSPQLKSTKAGREYGELVALWLRSNIGQTAPDFTQKDTADKPVSLYSLRGKYVLLNFWATWCGPCISEKPGFKKVYAEYKDKGFQVLDVSMIDKSKQFGDKKKWLEKVHTMHLPWINVYGDEAVDLYGIKSVPQNFLIDPTGKIIAKNLYPETLQTQLAALLK